MAEGTIKKLISAKGFGFIGPADGSDDVFFHSSGIENASFEEPVSYTHLTLPTKA